MDTFVNPSTSIPLYSKSARNNSIALCPGVSIWKATRRPVTAGEANCSPLARNFQQGAPNILNKGLCLVRVHAMLLAVSLLFYLLGNGKCLQELKFKGTFILLIRHYVSTSFAYVVVQQRRPINTALFLHTTRKEAAQATRNNMGGLLAKLKWGKAERQDFDGSLDAAGKTTVLYKLKLGELVTTITTWVSTSKLCSTEF